MLNGRYDAYVRAAIDGEVARLSAAQKGERNDNLFKASAALGGLGFPESKVIELLQDAADSVGLSRKEFHATLRSGVRAGRKHPRKLPASLGVQLRNRVSNGAAPLTMRQHEAPPAFIAGKELPLPFSGESRRHVYRRAGEPVRIKVKRHDGYVNWYRAHVRGQIGWQARKPDDYEACPYVGEFDPFDREHASEALYWPEGEKDCDTLGQLAIPAFTFGGVGDGLPDGCAEFIRDRQLVILADNDKVGRTHAQRKAMLASGIAATIKVGEFPELPEGADVSDYLTTHTVEDLQRRIDDTPYWREPDDTPPGRGQDRALLFSELADVIPEKIEWLWPGRVAIGKLAMIAGEPGLGKSQLAIAVAAAVTTGGGFPDSEVQAPRGSAIILSAEDGLADTIRPRFDAAGGDAAKVCVIRAVASGTSKTRRSFDLAADLELLEREILRRGDVRLVLIDPISSYLGRIDSHKNADVRSILEPVGELAERLRVAVLAITHLSKGDGKAINRFVGSIAFVAAARTAFAVVADPEDEDGLRRLLLQVKNNLAPPQSGLAFRLLQREVGSGIIASAVDWDRTRPIKISVDQALQGSASSGTLTAADDAREFLQEILAVGPVDVLDIEAEARAAAMLSDSKRLKASKPFRVAADRLGIVRKRKGFGAGARIEWSLPENGIKEPEEGHP